MTELLSGPATRTRHPLFAHHARAALEKHLPEARTGAAHWTLGANVAWVRFRREDGRHAYFALRRHLDWVSGEAGISREPLDLNDLSPLPGEAGARGHRIRLGELLDGRDRWWPAGDSATELDQRLAWLALQLAVRGGAHFRRWPRSER